MLSASGGLTSIPIFDNATSNETGGYHYGWFHFALRDRLRQASGGSSDNMIMWRSIDQAAAKKRLRSLDGGLQVRHVERSAAHQGRARAAEDAGTDGCYDKSTPPVFIADALKFTSKPDVRNAARSIRCTRIRATKPAGRSPPTCSSAS